MMFVKFQDRGTRAGHAVHALPQERSQEFCGASCLNDSVCDGVVCWAQHLIESQQGQKATPAANVPRRGVHCEARNRATPLRLVYSACRKAVVGGTIR